MRYLLPLLFGLVLFSCEDQENPPEPVRVIPALVKPHVDRFVLEAERRGFSVDLSKLSFAFQEGLTDASGNAGLVVASCSRSEQLHLVEIDTSNIFWTFAGEMGQEEVIFHELGHCLLERPHKDVKFTLIDNFQSIMRAQGSPSYGIFNPLAQNEIAHRRDYYLDELFDENTPEPCWASATPVSNFPLTVFEENYIDASLRFPLSDNLGDFWFTAQNTVYHYKNDHISPVLLDFDIGALATDTQGNIWIAGRQGQFGMVGTFINDEFQIIYEDQEPLGMLFGLNRFVLDAEDRLWVSTVQGDLFVEDDLGGFVEKTDEGSSFASGLRLSNNGNVLVVKGFQLLIYEDRNSTPLVVDVNSTLSRSGSISDFVYDGDGVLWLIVEQFLGGVTLVRYYPNGRVEELELADINMPDTFAQGLAVDSQGTIWLATSNGLKQWQGAFFSNYCLYNSGSPILSFSKVVVDLNGVVWSYGQDVESQQVKLQRLAVGN